MSFLFITLLALSTLNYANSFPQGPNKNDDFQSVAMAEIDSFNPSSQDALIAGANICTSDDFVEDQFDQDIQKCGKSGSCLPADRNVAEPKKVTPWQRILKTMSPKASTSTSSSVWGKDGYCNDNAPYLRHFYCGGPIIQFSDYISVLNCDDSKWLKKF